MERYYWLKLQKDFFRRHDIRIVEAMPNGKDYLLFYLKMLCESLSHDGNLRFSDTIPYSEQMLSTITNTNVDVVRSAIKLFVELDMMQVLDDGTLFMNEVEKMTGCAANNSNANRQRAFRERQRQKELPERNADVTKRNADVTPKADAIEEFTEDEELRTLLREFVKMRKEKKKPMSDRAIAMLLNKLRDISSDIGVQKKVLEEAIFNCWSSVYPLKGGKKDSSFSSDASYDISDFTTRAIGMG